MSRRFLAHQKPGFYIFRSMVQTRFQLGVLASKRQVIELAADPRWHRKTTG